MSEVPDKKPDLSRLKIDRTPKVSSSKWPLILFIILGSYIAWKEIPQLQTSDDTVVQSVRVQRRGGAKARTGTAANGYIVPRRRAALSTDIPGRLVELNVEEGSRVSEGDVVARLDSRELEAGQKRLQAEIKSAKAIEKQTRLALERQQKLAKTEDVSASALESAEASFEGAAARVQSLEASLMEVMVRLDKSTVYAPFSGVVVQKNAEVGEVVVASGGGTNARGSVATLVDFDTLEVQIELSQTALEAARVGAPLLIYLDAYPEEGYRGQVRQVWPTASRAKATVELRAEFLERDERLLPELGVRVVFVSEEESNPTPPMVLLSKSALIQGSEPAVFIIRDGLLEKRPLTLRDDFDDSLIEVGSGLIGGETVVMDPDPELKAGDSVKVGKSKP
ncbi:MAG: efflux RND transporter periplasmic adaptor subunit [Planctomycetota bacterium]|nr:efflux RND transporter periplasmic adaptor subunit [Planctomycetota bacterium]MDG2084400.1 efflux RND transporter periplasmic adaptor subunit [Planctomycetota bacterium]